jgi:hypothetical protein
MLKERRKIVVSRMCVLLVSGAAVLSVKAIRILKLKCNRGRTKISENSVTG